MEKDNTFPLRMEKGGLSKKIISEDIALEASILNELLKKSSEVIALLSEDGDVRYVSPSVEGIAEFSAEELTGENILSFVHPDDQESMGKLFQNLEALNTETLSAFRFRGGSGTYKFVEIQLNNQLDNPEIEAIIVNMQDITDSKKAREQLIKSERRLKRAQQISHIGNWEVDFRTQNVSWSDELYRILGFEPGDIEASLDNYLSYIHPEDRDEFNSKIEESKIKKEATSITHRVIRKDGSVRIVNNERRYQFDENGKPSGLYGILHDITDQVKTEEALKENALNLEEAFNIALIGTWRYDIVNNTFKWNQSAIDVIGFKKKDIPQNWEEYREFFHPDEQEKIFEENKKASQKGGIDIEHRLNMYGKEKWVRVKSHIEYDKEGNPERVTGIIQDITNSKLNENKLQKALEEKTALLAEVHHRVKNNLAIVSGLLELQRMDAENEELNYALNQSIGRISSIAMVHELIYQSDKLSSVNIYSYLESLIPEINKTMSSDQKAIDINLDLENYQLNITKAIPVGLLLNELLTNSFKYAFEGRKNGKINIAVKKHKKDKLKVIYEDDGVGFKDDASFENPDNLGLTLAHTQLNQLNASYKVDTKNRFRIELIFNAQSNNTSFIPLQ